VILDRIDTPGLAQVAYLVADEAAGEVAVLDPRRDVDAYLVWAAARGLRISAILETHVHADFVSGARELAAVTGAPIYASRLGNQEFPHEPLDDGQEVAVGRLRLRALWTPGHTPEHLAYLLIDPQQGRAPIALYSGDALFVGEVGRPDLLGTEQTEQLANQLYHTIVDRLSRLDDNLIVYPGHTAGSSCGKKIGDASQTTIGSERRFNYAFQARSKEGFVRMVLDGMPPAPTYYRVLKRVNKIGPALLADLPTGASLTPADIAARQATGALVIDARSPDAFGAGHVPGASFAGPGPDFTTWMGWLAPYDRELILILADDDQFVEARTELRRIGLDRVGGYLAGGMAAWRDEGREVVTLPQLSVHDLADRLGNGRDDLVVLDVRSDVEWADGHIPGAVHAFAGELTQGAPAPVEGTRPVAVICGTGYRSSVAASLLHARGWRNLINVAGGMEAWHEAGLPTSRDEADAPADAALAAVGGGRER
jgi:hydroxyacylglutathione hydrolase